MRQKTILVAGLASLAMIVLVAAGCGGGSKNAAATTEATTTEAATTEAATTTEATTTEAATTEAATTTEATTTTSNDLSGIATAGNCKELADLGQKFSSAMSGAASSQDLKKEAQLLKEFADKTPSDIKPDFEVYADFVSKVADAYNGVTPGSTPSPAQIAALQKLATEIDQAKLSAASQHIAAWVTKNCHA